MASMQKGRPLLKRTKSASLFGWVVAHLTSNGDLLGTKSLIRRPSTWGLEGQAANPASNEIAVVLRQDSLVPLLQLKYRE